MNVRVISLGVDDNTGGCGSGNTGCNYGGGLLLDFCGVNILLDCGINVGSMQTPDFSSLGMTIHAVLITDFLLDHCGALPVLTEKHKFSGQIYMSHATKTIAPALLKEFRKTCMERRDTNSLYVSKDIANCFRKVTAVKVNEEVTLGNKGVTIKVGYSGHIVGGTYFTISSEQHSFIYINGYGTRRSKVYRPIQLTDVNSSALITGVCCTNVVNHSRIDIEKEFLDRIHQCIGRGGKVHIPCFSYGSVLEIATILIDYWNVMQLDIPIYCTQEIIDHLKSTSISCSSWYNAKSDGLLLTKETIFQTLDMSLLSESSAVILTSPGLIAKGISYDVFKTIAPEEKNMLVLSEYCISGTMNYDILMKLNTMEVEKKLGISLKCSVYYLPPIQDYDARKLLHLINLCRPMKLILGYSEKNCFRYIEKLSNEVLGIPSYGVSKRSTVRLQLPREIQIQLSNELLPLKRQRCQISSEGTLSMSRPVFDLDALLFVEQEKPMCVIPSEEAAKRLELAQHNITFNTSGKKGKQGKLKKKLKKKSSALSFLLSDAPATEEENVHAEETSLATIDKSLSNLLCTINRWIPRVGAIRVGDTIKIRSIEISLASSQKFSLKWNYEDEDLAVRVMNLGNRLLENNDSIL